MNNKIEICEASVVDPEKVNRVKGKLPDLKDVHDLSETFKALGDATRLKIVLALAQEELCVCDLATVANISVSAISHQLRILKGLKIVAFRKSGKKVYYSLEDNHIENLVNEAMNHILE
ncbi:MAG TPA: ArsR family transcriptional regulator [Candidatus Aminicenantes bacterium]|nr:ArsR family transcriptional regulator [Candidatus Aminicenantes bacterium]